MGGVDDGKGAFDSKLTVREGAVASELLFDSESESDGELVNSVEKLALGELNVGKSVFEEGEGRSVPVDELPGPDRERYAEPHHGGRSS